MMLLWHRGFLCVDVLKETGVLRIMDVLIERSGERSTLSFTGSGAKLCELLGIDAQTVVIVRNDGIVTEDVVLGDDDTIMLLSVISGG